MEDTVSMLLVVTLFFGIYVINRAVDTWERKNVLNVVVCSGSDIIREFVRQGCFLPPHNHAANRNVRVGDPPGAQNNGANPHER